VSWDAALYAVTQVTACAYCDKAFEPPREERSEVSDWNYTHNTNGMIAAAYKAVSGEDTGQCSGPLGPVIGAAWWDRLDGASGPDGAAYLTRIITGLEADPERYRAMNPENGWGDYDGLLKVLREMRDAVPADEASVWEVSG
jgi:hypothetical protein